MTPPLEPPEATPGEPEAPKPTATPRRTVYEKLAGGTFAARCPACGEVQKPGSTRCPACEQRLVPWRQEAVCSYCGGDGRCERCGDDRPCTDCDGTGACPFCQGTGKQGGEACGECNGGGRCLACGGDGWRESVTHDFTPSEAWLPGICPTCVGGSGLCPDCGSAGKDAAGGTCLTCGGYGVCRDCGGTGLCAHDAGDGLCPVCRGGGREILDGEPRKPSERVWNLRTAAGSVVAGRVVERPNPNVHVMPAGGGTLQGLMRSEVHPLTYYLAHRDHVAADDAKGRMDLATLALAAGYWPLAQQDLRRAMNADATLSAEATAQLREVEARRILDWLKEAEGALKAGDRDRAVRLLQIVRFKAQGTAQATRAEVLLLQLRPQREQEEADLDAAGRERAAGEARARAARAAAGARARLERARGLLGQAQALPAADPGVERLFARADEAAWAAMRLVQREAWRAPAASVEWPAKPDALAREARLLRAEIAVGRAVREVAGGRFEVGSRLARRAAALDPSNVLAPKLVEQAELGLARAGVLRGSPPPGK